MKVIDTVLAAFFIVLMILGCAALFKFLIVYLFAGVI